MEETNVGGNDARRGWRGWRSGSSRRTDESMALRASKNRERKCRGSEKWNPSHSLPWLEEGRHYNTERFLSLSLSLSPSAVLRSLDRCTRKNSHSTTFFISNLYRPAIYRRIFRVSFKFLRVSDTSLSVRLCATCNPISFSMPRYDTINFDYRDIRLVSGNS